MRTLKDKEDLYLESKNLYYQGFPTMSDWEFDQLEEELKSLNSSVIEIVGAVENSNLCEHITSMLSLQKTQVLDINNLPIEKYNKWVNSLIGLKNDPILFAEATPKLDGSSCNLIYDNGILIKALTRGDGKVGSDIYEKMKLIVPNRISDLGLIEIRGEVVISTERFKKWSKQYKNPRNFVAGILGRLDHFESVVPDFSFVAFEMKIHAIDIENKSVDYISSLGFETPEFHSTYPIGNFAQMYTDFSKFRKISKYGLDGFVIKLDDRFKDINGYTDHHPKFAMAIKYPPMASITTIKSIEWNLGQTLEYSPVGILEPVDLDGSTVSRVALYNIGNIIENGLWPGAVVTLVKSGDIIPCTREVISPVFDDPYKHIPKSTPEYPIEIQGKHLMCTNPDCAERAIARLRNGIIVLDLENLGPATVEKLYYAGVTSIIDLFNPAIYNKVNLVTSGEFKQGKTLDNMLTEVNSKTSFELAKIVQALCFDNTGERMSVQIAKYLNNETPDWTSMNSKGYTPFLNENSIERKETARFIETLEKNNIQIIKSESVIIAEGSILVELTGSPKESGFKTKDEFLKATGFVMTKLDKNTTYLVTDDIDSESSKMTKAKKLGVKIITYAEAVNLTK